jgi:antitoxin PrlF
METGGKSPVKTEGVLLRSRLTSKAQTTIPQPIREALRLRPGDEIVYVIEGGRVLLSRVPSESDDPFSAFTEWDTEADRKAYAGL